MKTYKRWKNNTEDQRKGPQTTPSNKLTQEEIDQILKIYVKKEYVNLPPSQIVPSLADKGVYIASESSFALATKILKDMGYSINITEGIKCLKTLYPTLGMTEDFINNRVASIENNFEEGWSNWSSYESFIPIAEGPLKKFLKKNDYKKIAKKIDKKTITKKSERVDRLIRAYEKYKGTISP